MRHKDAMKKLTNAQVFLYMQVFFVIFGFALFFGLKAFKEARDERNALMKSVAIIEGEGDVPFCDFAPWVGKKVDFSVLNQIGRPYRIMPPGSKMNMPSDSSRINLHIDDESFIVNVECE